MTVVRYVDNSGSIIYCCCIGLHLVEIEVVTAIF